MKEKKQFVRISLILSLAIAVLVGFSAGVVGELWINQFLAPDIQFKDYRDLTRRLDALTTQQQQGLREILTEQDFSINRIVDRVRPTMVTFYPEKITGQGLQNIYLDTEISGAGFVLTSDGWLVAHELAVTENQSMVAAIGGRLYVVEKVVADSQTDVVFVKVAASNLPVVDFGSKKQLNVSQSLLAVTPRDEVIRTTIADLAYAPTATTNDVIHSSEAYYRLIRINNEVPLAAIGSPVFNLNGALIGIMKSQTEVMPIDYFNRVIKSAVQDGAVKRPYLGVHYIDIEQAVNFNTTERLGAVVFGGVGKPAVVAQSPAADAGLRAGDTIIKVENDEVNRTQSLSQLIQEYNPGTTITLTIIRDTQQQTVRVTLGEIKG